jgi:hypothetical protein
MKSVHLEQLCVYNKRFDEEGESHYTESSVSGKFYKEVIMRLVL